LSNVTSLVDGAGYAAAILTFTPRAAGTVAIGSS
jgi:hypothetical protein